MRNKAVMVGSAALLMAAVFVLPGINNPVFAAEKTVYVSVDRNIFGGTDSVIYEPEQVTISDSSTILDAVKQAAGSTNVLGSSGYISGMVDAGSDNISFNASDYQAENAGLFTNVMFDSRVIETNQTDDQLMEKEFSGLGGWLFTVNEATTYNGGANWYTVGTALSNVPDNAVIRLEYSLDMGADLGMQNASYLPSTISNYGSFYYLDGYASTPTNPNAVTHPRADRSELIRDLANNTSDPDWNTALAVLKNLKATQAQVDAAAALI